MPFKDYPLECPKCHSWKVQGSGARGEKYLYYCLDFGYESPRRIRFKKYPLKG